MEDGSIRSPFACSLRDENHLQVLQRIDAMGMAAWSFRRSMLDLGMLEHNSNLSGDHVTVSRKFFFPPAAFLIFGGLTAYKTCESVTRKYLPTCWIR